MQATDAWMVGALGSEELAAITPPGLVLFLLQSFGYGLLSSVTAYIAQAFGRDHANETGTIAWQGMYLGVGFGILMLPGAWIAQPVFELFNNESARVLELETIYLQITLFSLPAAFLTMSLSNFFVAVHRNRIVVVSTGVAVLANIPISYGLIHGLWGLPRLGLAGAGLGTVMAAFIEALLVFLVFLSPTYASRFGTRTLTLPKPRLLWGMMRVGLPAALQSSVDAASWGLVISWLVAQFGTAHQAACTILIRCMQLSFMPAEGVATAALTYVGNAVGARHFPMAKKYAQSAFILVALYMSLMGLAFFTFRNQIMGFFTTDPDVITIGVASMVFVGAAQFFDAMAVVYVHVLQAVGDTLWTLLVNLLLAGVVLVGGGLAVVHYFPHLGSAGLWALVALYIALLGISFWLRWLTGRWRRNHMLEA